MLPINQIILGDCLEVMRSLPDGCVDSVVTDPPYGTTNLAFDKRPVNLEAFWKEAHRVCKVNAAMVMFSAQPFTTDLIVSNRKHYRYDLIWQKSSPMGVFSAKKRPLRTHEEILIFSRGSVVYNPQLTPGTPYKRKRQGTNKHTGRSLTSSINDGFRYPVSILPFNNSNRSKNNYHPTQKPLDLMRWLVRTYTNPGELILDPYAGSGSTCHAALLENRNYIGIERDPDYHRIATQRIEAAELSLAVSN